MNKKITLVLFIIALLGIGAFLIFINNKNSVPTKKIKDNTTEIQKKSNNNLIIIKDHQIPQENLEVETGTTITWENKDDLTGLPYDTHTITSGVIAKNGKDGVLGIVPNSGSGISDGLYSKGLKLNDSFSYKFTQPGTYYYYIAEHPAVSGQGKIVVVDKKAISKPIRMTSGGFFFSPSTLNAKVGEEVNLEITSAGEHTFTIDELGVNVRTPNGVTTTVSFTPDKPGKFQYYCAIPGHKEAGQIGTLIVE